MLVPTWLLPAASIEDTVTFMNVLLASPSARQNQMIRGSASSTSYEAPWEYTSVVDDAAGTSVIAEIVNLKDEHASKLRLLLARRRPRCGWVALRVPVGLFWAVAPRQRPRRA